MPAITQPPSVVRARQATTYPFTLSGCVPGADPDINQSQVCSCDNWPSALPTLTGDNMCGYSVLSTSPSSNAGFSSATPDTSIQTAVSTLGNGGVVEYWLTLPTASNEPAAGPWPQTTAVPMSTSSLYSGKSMALQMETLASVNVGNMTGTVLYTAVSNALMSACTTSPGAPASTGAEPPKINECDKVEPIKGILYRDSNGNWQSDGELELTVTIVSYYDIVDLKAMISTIATAVNGSSLNANSTRHPDNDHDNNCWPLGKELQACNADSIGGVLPDAMVNIPTQFLTTYTQDTPDRHDWSAQNMLVEIALEEPKDEGPFKCADGALIFDGLAALSLIPGLEEFGFMAIPALGMSVTCNTLDHTGE